MMFNRFDAAYMIAQGASNPVGVSNTLRDAERQAMEEGEGTDYVRADPACRLITYQLAHLHGMEPVTLPYADDLYAADFKLCETVAGLRLTEAQYNTLLDKWRQLAKGEQNFGRFLASSTVIVAGDGAVAVYASGMWIAVETDGYAHT